MMFVAGVVVTLPPPAFSVRALETGWTVVWLALSSALLVPLLLFIHEVTVQPVETV